MKDETITFNFNFLKKIPNHNWAVIAYILVILMTILFLSDFSISDFVGDNISEKKLKPLVEEFINTQLIPGGNVIVTNIDKQSGIYVVIVTVDSESLPLYFTKDGRFITQGTGLIKINEPLPLLAN